MDAEVQHKNKIMELTKAILQDSSCMNCIYTGFTVGRLMHMGLVTKLQLLGPDPTQEQEQAVIQWFVDKEAELGLCGGDKEKLARLVLSMQELPEQAFEVMSMKDLKWMIENVKESMRKQAREE